MSACPTRREARPAARPRRGTSPSDRAIISAGHSRGTPSTPLELEEFDALPLEENDRLGRGHLNAGRYFPAHEAWETAWKQARDTPDAEFYKGLSQLGAGYVHLMRGNAHGAAKLLRRGAGRSGVTPKGIRGVDTTRVAAAAEALADAVEQGRVTPGDDARVRTTGHLTSSVKG